MKYEVGDRVRIKSIDWYNDNKDEHGYVPCREYDFVPEMSEFCGKILTIDVDFEDETYLMKEDIDGFVFTSEMIERLVERNGKIYRYNIGDRVVLKGNHRHATITDLKYNSFGNLSYYIKIDNDKDISIDIYDNMIEGLAKEDTLKPKFKVGDRVITDTNMKGKIIEVVEEGWYNVEFEPHNGIPQPNGVVPEESMSLVEEEIKPKFTVGDKITNGKDTLTILTLSSDRYVVEDTFGKCGTLYFNFVDDWKIVEEETVLNKWNGLKVELDLSKSVIGVSNIESLHGERFMSGFVKAIIPPEGYQFVDENGNVINATKIVLEKKKKEYPKTYEECCKILDWNHRDYDRVGYKSELLCKLQVLILCRDAYWKIAGEEMGLGKPWEPDWTYNGATKYCIGVSENEIQNFSSSVAQYILAFPTEEMRDAFKENFDPDIEICKEFL